MLVSLADMKTYLGIADASYDDFLTEQLNLISSAVENYCGRKFEAADWTQLYHNTDFNEDSVFYLYHYPVNSIASVKTVSTSLGVDTKTALETYQYRLKSDTGRLVRLDEGVVRTWFEDLGLNSSIEVIYNAGYSTVPYEVQSVVKSLVEERYNKKANGIEVGFGNDVQRVSIPGTIAVDFDYSLQANERNVRFGMLLGNYVNVLDPFRSERPLAGEIKENYVS
jgi:hypothetical protein